MNVIGYKGTPTKRLKTWLSAIESKKSYNTFKYNLGEQEQNIADLDKRLYDYYLNQYVTEKVA